MSQFYTYHDTIILRNLVKG